MAKFDPPRLSIGGLSGRVFVTTHGKILGHDEQGRELIESSVKYDVTDQFHALAALTCMTRERRENMRLVGGELRDEMVEIIARVISPGEHWEVERDRADDYDKQKARDLAGRIVDAITPGAEPPQEPS